VSVFAGCSTSALRRIDVTGVMSERSLSQDAELNCRAPSSTLFMKAR